MSGLSGQFSTFKSNKLAKIEVFYTKWALKDLKSLLSKIEFKAYQKI